MSNTFVLSNFDNGINGQFFNKRFQREHCSFNNRLPSHIILCQLHKQYIADFKAKAPECEANMYMYQCFRYWGWKVVASLLER